MTSPTPMPPTRRTGAGPPPPASSAGLPVPPRFRGCAQKKGCVRVPVPERLEARKRRLPSRPVDCECCWVKTYLREGAPLPQSVNQLFANSRVAVQVNDSSWRDRVADVDPLIFRMDPIQVL